MSIEDRFTDDEIFLLTNTPTLIGSVMAFAEGSGLGTIKELLASTKTFVDGVKKYPHNEIITGILPTVGEFKDAMDKAKEMRQKTTQRLKDRQIDSTEKLKDQLIEDSKEVAHILAKKATPEEAREYKEWAMQIAENVAKAAREGGFLGFGGTQISDGEKQAFTEIANALGADTHNLA